jgi:hypothetical protein
MSTLLAATFCPQVATKLFWIKANRVLAWSLIASPPLQIAAGFPVVAGLLIDLAILVAHGVLSLVLFGKPETKAKVISFGMHIAGFRPRGLGERQRFLLTGYRIAIPVVAITLISLVPSYATLALCLMCFYPLLRLPITVIQHIFGAVIYAFRRWGLRDYATVNAVIIVAVYLLLSVANLARG